MGEVTNADDQNRRSIKFAWEARPLYGGIRRLAFSEKLLSRCDRAIRCKYAIQLRRNA